jgi:hypothetical protein
MLPHYQNTCNAMPSNERFYATLNTLSVLTRNAAGEPRRFPSHRPIHHRHTVRNVQSATANTTGTALGALPEVRWPCQATPPCTPSPDISDVCPGLPPGAARPRTVRPMQLSPATQKQKAPSTGALAPPLPLPLLLLAYPLLQQTRWNARDE